MSSPYSTAGHITVREDLEPGPFVRVWELEALAWNDDADYDVVKCHLAHVNDVDSSGVPYRDERVSATCSFEDVPEDVQQEFVSQAADVATTVAALAREDDG